jgi:hypothetical protein
MSDQDLRELVAQLHERLRATGSLDDESHKLLTSALHDIEGALARSEGSSLPVSERLETLAVRFEADHPTLVVALRQLIDALGKAGI